MFSVDNTNYCYAWARPLDKRSNKDTPSPPPNLYVILYSSDNYAWINNVSLELFEPCDYLYKHMNLISIQATYSCLITVYDKHTHARARAQTHTLFLHAHAHTHTGTNNIIQKYVKINTLKNITPNKVTTRIIIFVKAEKFIWIEAFSTQWDVIVMRTDILHSGQTLTCTVSTNAARSEGCSRYIGLGPIELKGGS